MTATFRSRTPWVPPALAIPSLGTLLGALAIGGGCGSSGAADAGAAAARDSGAATEFNLAREVSLSQNPNGVWRYGYTRGTVLAASDFQPDTFTSSTSPVAFWHPSSDTYYPYIAANTGTGTVVDPTGSWTVRETEIALEGSPSGQYAVVQFVAPRAGVYEVQADFAGIHFRLPTTDVHVLRAAVVLLDAQIDGYGGDPAFHAREGATPAASYRGTPTLDAGEVLTFAVGFGPNRTNFNDTTGLSLHIRLLD